MGKKEKQKFKAKCGGGVSNLMKLYTPLPKRVVVFHAFLSVRMYIVYCITLMYTYNFIRGEQLSQIKMYNLNL